MRTITHFRITVAIALLAFGTHASAQTINAYRYWFDDNGASVVTTPVAGGQQYTLNAVDASALTKGYHWITVQFKDSNNDWGVPQTSLFYHNGGNLTAYQYWFDDEVTTLVETNVGATGLIDITTYVDASALSNGPHTITLRTKDQQNGFSVPITYSFNVMVGIEEIPGLDQVLLFPNPATDMLHLRFDAQAGAYLRFDVIDASGLIVVREERMVVTGSTLRSVGLEHLASGIYHLRIIGDAGSYSRPFTKL